ncbi:immunoglobulin-like domain-containing protein [Xylocopilactobacillus apis]|uniref:DUF5011 domain-containing protein n=1 Tax=Xylocopilactobacillus apis TaxID=2932183 RepID=A0AAU9DPL7_9LACO|nr:immunoglobulin-like domain-containing protein [Xylocopilactobacillus apis]BDR55458.1 hypothetical protein KIMC2_00200 [Xylocopilactobacillus apis]
MKLKLTGLVGTAILLLSPVANAMTAVEKAAPVQADNNWDYDVDNPGLGYYDQLLQNAGPSDGMVDWYPAKDTLSNYPTGQKLVKQLIELSIATNDSNSNARKVLFNDTNGNNTNATYRDTYNKYSVALGFIAQILDFNNTKSGVGSKLEQAAVAGDYDSSDDEGKSVIKGALLNDPSGKALGHNISDVLGTAFFDNADDAYAQIYINGYDNVAQNEANIIREATSSITIVAQSKITGNKATAIFKLNNKTMPEQLSGSILNNNIDGGIKQRDPNYKVNGSMVANAQTWVNNGNRSNSPTFWVNENGKGTIVVPRGTTAKQIAKMILDSKVDTNYKMENVAPMKAIQGNYQKGKGAPWHSSSNFNATGDGESYNHKFIKNSNPGPNETNKLPNGDNWFIGVADNNRKEANNEFAIGTQGNSGIYKGKVTAQSWFNNSLDTNKYPSTTYNPKTSAFEIPDFEASEGIPSFENTVEGKEDSPKNQPKSNIGKVTHLFNPVNDVDANGKSMLRESWDAQHYAYALPEISEISNGADTDEKIDSLAKKISENGSFQSVSDPLAQVKKSFTYEAPVNAWVFKSWNNPYSTVMSSEGAKAPMVAEFDDKSGVLDGSDPKKAEGQWRGGLKYKWSEGNLVTDTQTEVTAVPIKDNKWTGDIALTNQSNVNSSGNSVITISNLIDTSSSIPFKFDDLQIGNTDGSGSTEFNGPEAKINFTADGETHTIKIPKKVTTWARQGAIGVNQLYVNIANEFGNPSGLLIDGEGVSRFLTHSKFWGVYNPLYSETSDLDSKPLIKVADNHLNFIETFNTNGTFDGQSNLPRKEAKLGGKNEYSKENAGGLNVPNFASMYKFSGIFSVLKYKDNFHLSNGTSAGIIQVGDKITPSINAYSEITKDGTLTAPLGAGPYTVTHANGVPLIKMTFGETISQTRASKVAYFDSNLYNPHGNYNNNKPEDGYVSQDYSIGPASVSSVSPNDYGKDNPDYVGFDEDGNIDRTKTTPEDVVDSTAKRNRIYGNTKKVEDDHSEGSNPNYKMVNLKDLDKSGTAYTGITEAMKKMYGISDGKFLKASLPQYERNAGKARINVVVYDKEAVPAPTKEDTKPSFSTTNVSGGNDPFNVSLRPYTTTYDDGAVLTSANVPQSFKNLLTKTLVAGNPDLVDSTGKVSSNKLQQILISSFLESWQQNDDSFKQTDTGAGVNSPLYMYGGFGISNSDTKNSYAQWPKGYVDGTGDYNNAVNRFSEDFYRGGSDLKTADGKSTIKGIPFSALTADVSKLDVTKAGTYPVVYTYTNPSGSKKAASITVPVTVSNASAPVFAFQGSTDATINVGDSFNEGDYKVVGSWAIFNNYGGDYSKLPDYEGISKNTDGSPQVTVTGKVNTSTPGIYQLTYKAVSTSGATTTLIRNITVLPRSNESTTTPDPSDWKITSYKSVGHINYVPGYGIMVFNAPAGTSTGLRLGHGTSWKISQKAVNTKGDTYYQVGSNQWIDGKYISFSPINTEIPLRGEVKIIYRKGYGVNLWKNASTTNGYYPGRKLMHGSRWKVSSKQNGFYKVGKSQWIQGEYVSYKSY